MARGLYTVLAVLAVWMAGGPVAQAQHSCNEFALNLHHYQICYGESVTVEASGDTHGQKVTWTVSPQTGVSAGQGEGQGTGAIVFAEPGTYEVTFTLPGHDGHAAVTDKATVVVSAEKMKFLAERATFSKPLVKGQPADGIVLTVPVETNLFKDKNLSYGPVTLQTTGIPGITATLAETVTLKNGTRTVSFVLSGTPAHSGAAQIGFFNLMGEGFFHNFLIAEQ